MDGDGSAPARARRLLPLALVGLIAVSGLLAGAVQLIGHSTPAPAPAPTGLQPPPPLENAAAAYDPYDGVVLVFGGNRGDGVIASQTWTWDGVRWKHLTVSPSPSPRRDAVLLSDPAHRRMLLAGGTDSQGFPVRDVWSWQAGAWSEVTTAPQALTAPAVAWTSGPIEDGLVEVCACSTDHGRATQTWLWDGDTWRLVTVAHEPDISGHAVMVYDDATQELVLVTGAADGPPRTWEFDEIDWRRGPTVAGDVDAKTLRLVGDTASGRVLLTSEARTTLLWDGASWTDGGGVAPRFQGALVNDGTSTVLLVGPLAVAWVWDQGSWLLLDHDPGTLRRNSLGEASR